MTAPLPTSRRDASRVGEQSPAGSFSLPAGGVKRTAKQIIADAARRHDVGPKDMTGPSRMPHIVAARWQAMSEIRRELGWSYPRIGQAFGGRDHTTVMHGIKVHEARA